LVWANFTKFKYWWTEELIKEYLYKRSTSVNPPISTDPIEYKYQINIAQLPTRTEDFELINLISEFDSSDEKSIFDRSEKERKQLTSNFNCYDPIEVNTFNELCRTVQLIFNEYNPSKLSSVRCNFKSNNNVQFIVLPNMNCMTTRGLQISISRVINKVESSSTAPWPEYQMLEVEKIWLSYANKPDNQLSSNVLSQDALLDIQRYL